MQVIDQYHEMLTFTPDPIKLIEQAGRTCYKSEHKITDHSAARFVEKITELGHHSVLEHASATVKLVTDRGVLAELTRHRIGIAFSVESTRFVSYTGEMQFIRPVWVSEGVLGVHELVTDELDEKLSLAEMVWLNESISSANSYNFLMEEGWPPQKARQLLNHSVKTEIVITANFREWKHIFNLRCSRAAHPQIRDLMQQVELDFASRWPEVFGG